MIGVAEEHGCPVLPPAGIDPDQVDGILKELLNLGNHAIQPPFHPIAAPYKVDGRTILVVWAPGGESRPYRARTSLGNVVGGPSEAPFPKNVRLLFFNDSRHRFFPATQIDFVYFPEGAGGHPTDVTRSARTRAS